MLWRVRSHALTRPNRAEIGGLDRDMEALGLGPTASSTPNMSDLIKTSEKIRVPIERVHCAPGEAFQRESKPREERSLSSTVLAD